MHRLDRSIEATVCESVNFSVSDRMFEETIAVEIQLSRPKNLHPF